MLPAPPALPLPLLTLREALKPGCGCQGLACAAAAGALLPLVLPPPPLLPAAAGIIAARFRGGRRCGGPAPGSACDQAVPFQDCSCWLGTLPAAMSNWSQDPACAVAGDARLLQLLRRLEFGRQGGHDRGAVLGQVPGSHTSMLQGLLTAAFLTAASSDVRRWWYAVSGSACSASGRGARKSAHALGCRAATPPRYIQSISGGDMRQMARSIRPSTLQAERATFYHSHHPRLHLYTTQQRSVHGGHLSVCSSAYASDSVVPQDPPNSTQRSMPRCSRKASMSATNACGGSLSPSDPKPRKQTADALQLSVLESIKWMHHRAMRRRGWPLMYLRGVVCQAAAGRRCAAGPLVNQHHPPVSQVEEAPAGASRKISSIGLAGHFRWRMHNHD